MTFARNFAVTFFVAIPALLSPVVAAAGCELASTGARCVEAPASSRTAVLPVGAVVPQSASMLINPEYYGLPPVSGHWRYYRIKGQVYEVQPETMEVLNLVSGGNAIIR